MSIELSPEIKALLNITPTEMDKIRLASNLKSSDVDSCKITNSMLVDCFQIINNKVAILKAAIMRSKEEEDNFKNETIEQLALAKSQAAELDNAKRQIQEAKEAWEKGGKVGDFIPPADLSQFVNASLITRLPPAKFTDQTMKAIAEKHAAAKYMGVKQLDLLEAKVYLEAIRDGIKDVGSRIDTQSMLIGIENKMSGGNR